MEVRTDFVTLRLTLLVVFLLVILAAGPHVGNAADNRKIPYICGADISLLPMMERQGVIYNDGGRRIDVVQALHKHGVNCIRLRLWVNPSHRGTEVNDLLYTIALAKRVKRAGMMLMLDLHYSDTWADPRQQNKPAAWSRLTFNQLVTTVYSYSRDTITAMRKAGAMPDIVQVGNEITGGFLWPDGKNWGPGNDFRNLGILLKSGIKGIYAGSANSPKPKILLHIDRGSDWNVSLWFFDGIRAQGVPYDIIGLSYYPQINGRMGQLGNTLYNAAKRYKKPIIIVETAYQSADNTLPRSAGQVYPETPAGQRQYLIELNKLVEKTPNGLGAGIVYWEPEWLPTKGLGGQWNTTAMFDNNGNMLPSVAAFGKRQH